MNNDKIDFRKLTPSDKEQFIECLNSGFTNKRLEELFDWQYLENPAGSILGYGAFMDERLVGIYVVSPVRFQINHQVYMGSQSMDTVVSPEARKRGLFRDLGTLTYQDLAKGNNIFLTYGFPNGNSFHGLKKYLGWQFPGDAPFMVRLLNLSYVTKRLKLPIKLSLGMPAFPGFSGRKKYKVQCDDKLPKDVDTLWKDFSSTFSCGVVRDLEYLRWRFEKKPAKQYIFFDARDTQGRLSGLGILNISHKHGGLIGYVMELMTTREDIDVGKIILHDMVKTAYQMKAEVMIAWAFRHHQNRKIFRGQGFHPLPKRFWPVDLHFGFTVHSNEEFLKNLSDLSSWYISYADSDTN